MTWYWVSFTDDTRAEGDRLLGVSIVDANDEGDAVAVARDKGCNPGGDVMILDLTGGGHLDVVGDPASPLNQYGPNRLISPDELIAAGERKIKDLPPDGAAIVDHIDALGLSSYVHAECNKDDG